MVGFSTDEQRLENYDFFKGAFESHKAGSPQYISEEADKYGVYTNQFKLVLDRHMLSRVDKSGISIKVEDWRKRVSDAIKETYYQLKSKNESKLPLYFANLTLSKIKTDTDNLKVIDNIISLNSHPDTPDLKQYDALFRQLRAEGSALMSNKGQSNAATNEINKAREDCDHQLQKLKYLMRGYFYNTGYDYTALFKDMQGKSGKHTEKPEEKANPDLKPVKPVDRIFNGTVVVPPPVIAPVIAPEKKNP